MVDRPYEKEGPVEKRRATQKRKPQRERELIATEDMAMRMLLDTCARLGVDGTALLERTIEAKRAVRILTSYRRRLAFFADRELKGQAMLVGLTTPVLAHEEQSGRQPQ